MHPFIVREETLEARDILRHFFKKEELYDSIPDLFDRLFVRQFICPSQPGGPNPILEDQIQAPRNWHFIRALAAAKLKFHHVSAAVDSLQNIDSTFFLVYVCFLRCWSTKKNLKNYVWIKFLLPRNVVSVQMKLKCAVSINNISPHCFRFSILVSCKKK